MTRISARVAAVASTLLLAAGPGWAQQAQAPAAPPPAPAALAPPATPPAQAAAQPAKDSLSVFFDTGSAALRAQDRAVLDQAARLYRAGQPIVMILTASTDPTGSAIGNLSLSQRRANTVLHGLVSRGIPAERFQILAKGESDLPVPAKRGQPEPRDRQVQIAWR